MTTIAGMEALREKANVQGRVDALEQFRVDFALVYRTERGYLNDEELAQAREQAGQYVREHMGDAQAMTEMTTLFRGMADAIRRDTARSERIRAEVRAERGRAA